MDDNGERKGFKPVKEEIAAEIQYEQTREMFDAAGVEFDGSNKQTHMVGFEGQPEKVILRGRGSAGMYNSPFTKDPEATAASLANAMKWRRIGMEKPARTNQEISQRIDEYFTQCINEQIKPTVEGMSLALGYARMSVWNWKNGIKCDSERQKIIQIAYDTIASFDADMVTNGCLNPVVYIFRSKNFYEMRDQSEVIVTPNNPLGDVVSVEEIEEKYKELPEE